MVNNFENTGICQEKNRQYLVKIQKILIKNIDKTGFCKEKNKKYLENF